MEPIRKELHAEQSKFLCGSLSVPLKNYSREPQEKIWSSLGHNVYLFSKKTPGRKSSDACLILMESKYVPHPLKTLIKATLLFFNDGPINLPVSMKVTVIY